MKIGLGSSQPGRNRANVNNYERRAVNDANSPGPYRTHICAGAPRFSEVEHVDLLRYVVAASQSGRNHANVNNSKQRAVDDTDSPNYNTHKCAGASQISEAGHGKGWERAKKCEIRPGKANVNNSKQRAVDDDTDSPEPYNTHKYAGAPQISEAGHENGWERAGKGEKVRNKTWKGEC